MHTRGVHYHSKDAFKIGDEIFSITSPNKILVSGALSGGSFLDIRLLITINRIKYRAALTLYWCLAQMRIFDKRFLSMLCRDYVMIGLNGRCYWEHLVTEPFLNTTGRKEWERLVKLQRASNWAQKEYIYSITSRKSVSFVSRQKRMLKRRQKEVEDEIKKYKPL